MYHDIECPYCGHGQEVCHDDGFGYEEDVYHEMECSDCERWFTFTTMISFDYTPRKADCLNEGEHNLKMSTTYPKMFSKMHCDDCEYERTPTTEEYIAAGIDIDFERSKFDE